MSEQQKKTYCALFVGGLTVGALSVYAIMRPRKYKPPRVWKWKQGNGGKFASINRPISGATKEAKLPVGKHQLQLYSLATPNGVKVTTLLEELYQEKGVEYDAWLISILRGDQFGSGFVEMNPNSKIPALLDHSTNPPTRLFESGSILLYLAEKYDCFLPKDPAKKAECINWVMWQMGSAPYLGGGFGHFYTYAPEPFEYPINRFTMETKRQLHVLDQHLAKNKYMCGDEYTIADMAIWPWYGNLVIGKVYPNADVFLEASSYPNLLRWSSLVGSRAAAKRGRMVNRSWGPANEQVPERHQASDFDHCNLE